MGFLGGRFLLIANLQKVERRVFESTATLLYLDPGSGSAIISGIIAAVAAAGVAIKLYWYRFLRILGFGKKSPLTKTDSDPS